MQTARELRATWPVDKWPELDHACALAIAIGVELGFTDDELEAVLIASFQPEPTALVAYCRSIAAGNHPSIPEFDEANQRVKSLIQPVFHSQKAPLAAPEGS